MCTTTRVVQSCVLDMRYRDTEKLGEEGRGGYKCGCWVFSVREYSRLTIIPVVQPESFHLSRE
jgi:hypothetical protein